MGYENTAPRNQIILGVAVGTVVVLGALHFVFDSYFVQVRTAKNFERVLGVPAAAYNELRADAIHRLGEGAVPVSKAMAAVGSGARPAEVAPNLDDDNLDALSGWAQTPAPKRVIYEAKRRRAEFLVRDITARLTALRSGAAKPDPALVAQLEGDLTKRKAELAELLGQKPAAEPGEPVEEDTADDAVAPSEGGGADGTARIPEGAVLPTTGTANTNPSPFTTSPAPKLRAPQQGAAVRPMLDGAPAAAQPEHPTENH